MGRSFTIKLPIYIETGVRKKRKHYLNLNLYRNFPYHLNNSLKRELKRIVEPLLPSPEEVHYEHFELEYKLYLPNRLGRDISNLLSVIDKFFCDALVENGNVPDDNYKYLKKVVYMYGGMDEKRKGYVDVTIKEVEDESAKKR